MLASIRAIHIARLKQEVRITAHNPFSLFYPSSYWMTKGCLLILQKVFVTGMENRSSDQPEEWSR